MIKTNIDSNVPVGGSFVHRKRPLTVSTANNGCMGCVFQKTAKASQVCNHMKACMSINRQDGISVIFTIK
jgi:hypothetical protein